MREKRPSFAGTDHSDDLFSVFGFCFTTHMIKIKCKHFVLYSNELRGKKRREIAEMIRFVLSEQRVLKKTSRWAKPSWATGGTLQRQGKKKKKKVIFKGKQMMRPLQNAFQMCLHLGLLMDKASCTGQGIVHRKITLRSRLWSRLFVSNWRETESPPSLRPSLKRFSCSRVKRATASCRLLICHLWL